jgi:hypothetical protein
MACFMSWYKACLHETRILCGATQNSVARHKIRSYNIFLRLQFWVYDTNPIIPTIHIPLQNTKFVFYVNTPKGINIFCKIMIALPKVNVINVTNFQKKTTFVTLCTYVHMDYIKVDSRNRTILKRNIFCWRLNFSLSTHKKEY